MKFSNKIVTFSLFAATLLLGGCNQTLPADKVTYGDDATPSNVSQQVQASETTVTQNSKISDEAEKKIQQITQDVNSGKPIPSNKEIFAQIEKPSPEPKELDIAKPDFRIGIVNDKNSDLNCRREPDASLDNVVTTYKNGTQIGVTGVTIADNSRWYLIAENNCWVYGERLTPTTPSFIIEQQLQEQRQLEDQYQNGSSSSSQATTTTSTPSHGHCDTPDQVDSRGRRCGGRAASVRRGGR